MGTLQLVFIHLQVCSGTTSKLGFLKTQEEGKFRILESSQFRFLLGSMSQRLWTVLRLLVDHCL